MKTYQNPQPYAVDRINKIQNKPTHIETTKHEIKTENSIFEESDTEIFLNESEEQAWRDVLEKDKSHKNI
ncbi:hypothetical protein A6J40_12655 [Legionella longbeachae]|uniref:hypothetical protein n=1 Tax=Legionella longbeachae TaxID=450 RepID=UPI0009B75962|nr:hypothetical protein [Legionella longbeachae]ARB92977.1 hypothetical protein A6J40_12655 [Legionella longbeachae]RZV26629.1 hypothetical protein EKG34_05680 [Legionella longbeachae]UAK47130.1 hypothetical protein K8O86_02770 [Legionella longbeachae]VEE04194.1 Uncharacterised protein [Legionella oakridgensis]